MNEEYNTNYLSETPTNSPHWLVVRHVIRWISDYARLYIVCVGDESRSTDHGDVIVFSPAVVVGMENNL